MDFVPLASSGQLSKDLTPTSAFSRWHVAVSLHANNMCFVTTLVLAERSKCKDFAATRSWHASPSGKAPNPTNATFLTLDSAWGMAAVMDDHVFGCLWNPASAWGMAGFDVL